MRKFIPLAATAVLLTTAATPAWAAAADAPTDVQVGRVDGKNQVTWVDDGEANVVRAEYLDTGVVDVLTRPAADAANKVQLKNLRNSDRIRVTVTSVNSAQEESTAGVSGLFDALHVTKPALTNADLLPDRSIRVQWTYAAAQDLTPGDPLDSPDLLALDISGQERIPLPAGSTSYTLPARTGPAQISVAVSNSWSSTFGTGRVQLGTLQAAIAVPAQAVYGGTLGITSTINSDLESIAVPIEIQARTSKTAAWKTIGRWTTYPGQTRSTPVNSPGAREYRLWASAVKEIDQSVIKLAPAVSTSARSSKSFANVYNTRFEPATTAIGTTTNLSVHVNPEVSMNAALQQLVGTTWKHVRSVPITNGRAYIPTKATSRGTVTFRIVTPVVQVNGLQVEPGSSKPFTLTIR
ncbi:hypothetical protein OG474_21260 [Kribbella sp. NBC_01505]|uniref:hypothetical protein n=1 Tax=Kribbella sp. NBC_01505 TaxID=2903580 RepID=UPI00386E9CE5